MRVLGLNIQKIIRDNYTDPYNNYNNAITRSVCTFNTLIFVCPGKVNQKYQSLLWYLWRVLEDYLDYLLYNY